MNDWLQTAAFAAAALCALTMGYAIQRGATCTVAAVDELLRQRRAARLRALLEAALWVGGGLLLARHLHLMTAPLTSYALNGWTITGAALLGGGAYINRACVFGAIARLGSGEWAYLATPLGFYLGCVSVATVFAPPAAQALPAGSAVLDAPGWVLPAFGAYLAWRIGQPLLNRPTRERRVHELIEGRWPPHLATLVIGLSFLAMLLLVGAWAYTDVLAELAHGMAGSLLARSALLLCLLAGAMLGGWRAGRLAARWPSSAQILRCAAGGLLMGWGSLLIPGGNDGLILVGMPLLWPYAWAAFATMCAVIAAAQGWQLRRAAA